MVRLAIAAQALFFFVPRQPQIPCDYPFTSSANYRYVFLVANTMKTWLNVHVLNKAPCAFIPLEKKLNQHRQSRPVVARYPRPKVNFLLPFKANAFFKTLKNFKNLQTSIGFSWTWHSPIQIWTVHKRILQELNKKYLLALIIVRGRNTSCFNNWMTYFLLQKNIPSKYQTFPHILNILPYFCVTSSFRIWKLRVNIWKPFVYNR